MADTKTEKRAKDVGYGFTVVDELPAKPPIQKTSVLNEQVSKLKKAVADGQVKPNQWANIADYREKSGVSSAMVALRKRHGKDQEVDGVLFDGRPIDGGKRWGLFATYDPSKIVKGKLEAFLKAQEKAAEAKAAEGNGSK